MEYFLLVLNAAIVGAIGFRLRGGMFGAQIGWGSTTARLAAWALPMSLLVYLHAPDATTLWLPVMVVAWWLGCLLGWWESLDMGRMHHTLWRDMLMHSVRGMAWVVPPGLALSVLRGVPEPTLYLPLLAGALCGPVYALGYKLSDAFGDRFVDFGDPWPTVGSEWGEYLFGALVAVAFVLAL